MSGLADGTFLSQLILIPQTGGYPEFRAAVKFIEFRVFEGFLDFYLCGCVQRRSAGDECS